MFRYANGKVYLANDNQDNITILLENFIIYEPKTLIDDTYQEIVYSDTIKYEIQNNTQTGLKQSLQVQIEYYLTQFDTYKALENERINILEESQKQAPEDGTLHNNQ